MESRRYRSKVVNIPGDEEMETRDGRKHRRRGRRHRREENQSVGKRREGNEEDSFDADSFSRGAIRAKTRVTGDKSGEKEAAENATMFSERSNKKQISFL